MREPQMAVRLSAAVILLLLAATVRAGGSLPPLVDGRAPRNLTELWGNYNPRAEPLETQAVREWADDGITLRYVVFTIGTFKGKRSRLAAFYGFPKSDGKLPALLHMHGGGQRASIDEALFAARNGYAGLSINWGGRPMEEMKEGEANTDWGAVDATQSGHNSHYASLEPDAKTLDAVESPRNNNWFLLILAARRSLTFLERQPEVDAQRLGVHGHSMGGKLTTDLAGIDRRVKAAVPSCGGSGSAPREMPGSGLRASRSPLHLATIDDQAYISAITCPILYLGPTNDFNGALDSMYANWQWIGSKDVRYSISPHLNHRHIEPHAVCRILWFEQWLKKRLTFPPTPELSMAATGKDGVPHAIVMPDDSMPVEAVDIYYSVDPHVLTRFWRDAGAKRQIVQWAGACPILSVEQPLFVLANVTCRFDLDVKQPRTGTPYERRFTLSSRLVRMTPKALVQAGAKATDKPSLLIDDFARGWRDWYRIEWRNPVHWVAATRKLKDPKWRGSDGARLLLDVRPTHDNLLVVTVDFNDWNAYPGEPSGTFAAVKELEGTGEWQTVAVSLSDLVPAGKPPRKGFTPTSWRTVTELSLRARMTLFRDGKTPELVERHWQGPRDFRNLRWEAKTVER